MLTFPSSASVLSHPWRVCAQEQCQSVRDRLIHHPQRLYGVTRAPSIHQKGRLLPFKGLRGWTALLSLKNFQTSLACLLVGTVSSSVAVPQCARIPLARNARHNSRSPGPLSAAHVHLTWLSSAGTTKHLVARMSAEVFAVFPTARLSNTCFTWVLRGLHRFIRDQLCHAPQEQSSSCIRPLPLWMPLILFYFVLCSISLWRRPARTL